MAYNSKSIKKGETQRVACYLRVSTTEQVKEWYGLDTQDRILRAFVQANEDQGWMTSESLIYRDEGVSGATEVDERPALSRLKMDILDGKIDTLLVWKIDRLFRKTSYLLEFIEFLKQHNINFVSKNENIDLSSPTGKLVLTLLGAISEMERDVITERTSEGKLSKALQGYLVYGNSVPYGYKKVHDGHGNKLAVHEEETKIIQEIFNMYVLEDKSSSEIARIFTARNIWGRGDTEIKAGIQNNKIHSGLFRQSTIIDYLRNEIYIGNYYCNKYETHREGKRNTSTLKDPSEWVLIKCDAIIDEKIWKRAQEKLSKGNIMNGRWETHIFTGLLKCAECGRSFNYYKSHKWTGNYRCGGKKRDKVSKEHICRNRDISEEKVMNSAIPVLNRMLLHAESFIKDYEEWKGGMAMEKRKNALEKELIEIRNTIIWKEELRKKTIRKGLESSDDSIYTSIVEDISKEVKILEDRRKEISKELQWYEERQKIFEAIREAAKQYINGIGEVNEKDKIFLIRKFINGILVEKERLRFLLRIEKVWEE